MSWTLSRFRAGDIVEVRSKEEILATLDSSGCLDGMPFMPEMLQYCGRQFGVRAVAHKTCDTVREMGTGRRLRDTVHLDDLRCDGSAHGGCQAECTLFWKDSWLKPVRSDREAIAQSTNGPSDRCTEANLLASARHSDASDGDELRFRCQATQLYDATDALPWWDVRQYVFDVVTGNHSIGRVIRVLWLSSLRWLLPRVPFGYRILRSITEKMHIRFTGRASPAVNGAIEIGASTPTGRLDLKPGDLVRIKSQAEIEKTLNKSGKNRGLNFDAEEMGSYCGRTFQVRSCVTQIIDEPTGRMRQMKQPCIILQGVVCKAEYAGCRLNCPRAIPAYWRELWLERVETAVPNDSLNSGSSSKDSESAISHASERNLCSLQKQS